MGLAQSILERRAGGPVQRRHTRDVEELAWRTSGFGGVGDEIAPPAGGLGDETGQFQDAQILADTHIDRAFVGLGLEEKPDRVGKIVDAEEFAAWRSGPPDFDREEPLGPGLMNL
jgi:hypothetical protein